MAHKAEQCSKHNVDLECLEGRNAHPNSWYCPMCWGEHYGASATETLAERCARLEKELRESKMRHQAALTIIKNIRDALGVSI